MPEMKSPYLSVVVPLRNDDHGGDMMRRFRASLTNTWEQCERFGLDSEYLVVEYNPPGDMPRLRDAVDWPTGMKHTSIRIVEVPPQVHAALPGGRSRGFTYCFATNAGLRRARGTFLLPSTIDHLMAPELVAMMACRNLDEEAMYRTDRCDVDRRALDLPAIKDMLSYCPEHVIERFVRPKAALAPDLPLLHTDAPGDFLLLSRKWWHRLQGFLETDPAGYHIDSILMFAAHGAGLKERFIEGTLLFHIDHDNTFVDRLRRGDRDAATGKTIGELWPRHERLMVELGRKLRRFDMNGPNWGIGGVDLPETTVWRAVWECELACPE